MGWIGRRLATAATLALLLAQLASSFGVLMVSAEEPTGTAPLVKVNRLATVIGAEKTLSPVELQSSIRQGVVASGGELVPASAASGVVTSSPVTSPIPFSHVGLRWRGTLDDLESLRIELRVSRDGVAWTDWRPLEVDDDLQFGADGQRLSRLADYDIRDGAYNYAQARLTLLGSNSGTRPSISSLSFSFVNPYDGPASGQISASRFASASTAEPQAVSKPPVVSRTSWGSPDGQSSPDWPPEYRTVTNIIVHHTATSNSAIDWPAEVRAIWYYHAITNKWGDIGYNFLVDPNGVVYEGRAGGDDVVAGHALQYNWGSMGATFLGDFTSVAPSTAAQNSMINLLSWKADQRGIDPMAMSTYFVDKNLPAIMGHRNALYTSCPGDVAYSLLSSFRGAVRDRIGAPGSIEILSSQIAPAQVTSGNLLKVAVTVRNNGSSTAQTQGPAPGFVYSEGDQYTSVEAEKYGRFRVGLDFSGRSQSADHPYRWGLGKDLAPGETTTVVGYVRLSTVKTTNYWTGLVQEGVAWIADDQGSTPVRVTGAAPPSSKVAPLPRFVRQPFPVSWSGTNTAVKYYIEYRDGLTGNWNAWPGQYPAPAMQAQFSAGEGHTYYFRSLAEDASGNRESKSADQYDAFTTVDNTAPVLSLSVPPNPVHNWFVINWSGSDAISGMANYDVDISGDGMNTWQPWLRGATGTSALFVDGVPGASYFFRLTGRDLAGNASVLTSGRASAGYDTSGLTRLHVLPIFKSASGGW
ncbi:MAG: N-acetylmuramoyl-L-alanine amidase [Chloroflexi bacterium]|nr:N-acetylmuramoyl-L-alanine amidase [Chloroflexota bacterium]